MQPDLGKAVTAGSLLVQVVLQQPLAHILNDLDEPQIPADGERSSFSHTQVFKMIQAFLCGGHFSGDSKPGRI